MVWTSRQEDQDRIERERKAREQNEERKSGESEKGWRRREKATSEEATHFLTAGLPEDNTSALWILQTFQNLDLEYVQKSGREKKGWNEADESSRFALQIKSSEMGRSGLGQLFLSLLDVYDMRHLGEGVSFRQRRISPLSYFVLCRKFLDTS